MNLGRPPIFSNKEDLQKKIDSYFADVPTKTIYIDSNPVEIPVVTITGLTLYLGFCDRASFYDYEKRDGFSHTIKTARLRVENDYEMQLRTSATGQAGTIFALKNLGWSDGREDAPKEVVNNFIIDTSAKRD